MVAVVGGSKVFVAHRATGVRLIPAEWLDAWRPSGFREATPAEVVGWYDEREIDPPAEVLRAVGADAVEDGERRRRPITLRGDALPEREAPAPVSAPMRAARPAAPPMHRALL
jgi:hypothetical protein